MKYAAIDIGSNAIRLLIADILQLEDETTFKKNMLVRLPIRLGDDSFLYHHISERKANDLIKAMVAFRNLMDIYQVEEYMACATSAMREVDNGAELVEKIKKTGIDLTIIDGYQEAKIIYSYHFEKQLDVKKTYLYIDVGGGSTELSVFHRRKLVASKSFDIGTIRILDHQDQEESWLAMKQWVKNKTQQFSGVVGIGTGGNINKLYVLANVKPPKGLSYHKLKAVYEHLSSFSLKDRINVLDLKPDRADVIIPASEIFLNLMKWGKINQILVPRIGLVDGMIQTLIDRTSKS